MQDPPKTLQESLAARYSDAPDILKDSPQGALALSMASRGSCRDFLDKPIPDDLVNLLCATALASPTKSDMQQRDIIHMTSPDLRQQLAALVPGQDWVARAPTLLVFCGNNRRQKLLHDWSGVPFANDHLDAFFNAATDAAIALGAFVTAAEAVGLGCCPISAIRNQAAKVSDLLRLPQRVFPFAGLAVGYPKATAPIARRLPLAVTCHKDCYREDGLREAIQHYDTDRARSQPYPTQRFSDEFAPVQTYGWSTDKVRQYSRPERADFGAFIRQKGFRFE